MSDKEKKVYGFAVILIIGMCLFPPWHIGTPKITLDKGYAFIAAPPDHRASINLGRLAIQVFVVGIAAFGLAKLTK